jgi:hypothetical protein
MNISKQRDFLLKEAKFNKPLNEMAKIQGGLKATIEAIIEENPDLDGLALKKIIRADGDVIDLLDGDELYDNQLNKFISLYKGQRTLQKRGRKTSEDSPLNEMAKIEGSLKDAINAVIDSNPDLNGLPLKKAIRSNGDVLAALGKSVIHDNQLNRYIAQAKGETTVGKRGRKASTDSVAKTDISSDLGSSTQSLDQLLDLDDEVGLNYDELPIEDEEEIDIEDTWNTQGDEEEIPLEKGPLKSDIDNSFEKDSNIDGSANAHKNIITKKVSKIEKAKESSDDEAYKREMAALKQYIKKPEVKKGLGMELIRSLTSSIIG